MQRSGAVVFLLLLTLTPAAGQWVKNAERAGDAAERKAVGGFGAHLLVVEDPQGFIREWVKPEPPRITTASTVKPGKPIGVLVLFAGCKPDAQGACRTEVDYAVYKPDGGLYAERKEQTLWKEEAPPPPVIQLGRAILVLKMRKDDPAGEYKVKAKVRDLNADIAFELETRFSLAK